MENGRITELFQKEFESSAELADITKSPEGQAIDTVFEYEASGGVDIDNKVFAEALNKKFGVEFTAEDVEMIREAAHKEMSMDIEVDFSKALSMDDIKELLKDDLDKIIEQSHGKEENIGLTY